MVQRLICSHIVDQVTDSMAKHSAYGVIFSFLNSVYIYLWSNILKQQLPHNMTSLNPIYLHHSGTHLIYTESDTHIQSENKLQL